jgi:hypothetical protein
MPTYHQLKSGTMKKLSKQALKKIKGGNDPFGGVVRCPLGDTCYYKNGIKAYEDRCIFWNEGHPCNCGNVVVSPCPSPDGPNIDNPPMG